MEDQGSGSLTKTVGIAATEAEKDAIDLAARVRGRPVSQLLREMSFTELLAEGQGHIDRLRREVGVS